MRVLVCGGRNFKDWKMLCGHLDALPITEVIEGGATGADLMGRQWAARNGVSVRTFEADWERHGRAAGPLRNQQMLDTAKPDLVIAFPGGRGTADMVARAERAGVPVEHVR